MIPLVHVSSLKQLFVLLYLINKKLSRHSSILDKGKLFGESFVVTFILRYHISQTRLSHWLTLHESLLKRRKSYHSLNYFNVSVPDIISVTSGGYCESKSFVLAWTWQIFYILFFSGFLFFWFREFIMSCSSIQDYL